MDPREKLLQLGAQLLDATYATNQDTEKRKRLEQAKNGPKEVLDEAIEQAGGITYLLAALERALKVDQLRAEYCLMRSTIEAMEGTLDRTDDIVPGIVNPERGYDA